MTIFNGVRLYGFNRGQEVRQFVEEMEGEQIPFITIAQRAIAAALAEGRRGRGVNPYCGWLKDVLEKKIGLVEPDWSDQTEEEKGLWKKLNQGEITPTEVAELLRLQAIRRARRRRMKEKARAIGLAYWPALFTRGVDPRAFAVAEGILAKRHGYWGETAPDGTRGRGGWDSAGHYGLSPWDVKQAWYIAGCQDSPKFRAILRAILGGVDCVSLFKKGDSLADTLSLIRGYRWLKGGTGKHLPMSRKALMALGRVSAWARWTAISGLVDVDEDEQVTIRVRDLNWAEVARLQGLPAWKRIGHCPPRLAWQMVHGVDIPKGIPATTPVLGWKVATYTAICQAAGIDPWEGDDTTGGLRLPIMNLTRLFGSVGEASRFVKMRGGSWHDAGQFVLPTAGWTPAGWRRLAFKHPQVLEFSGRWAVIEDMAGGVPNTLNEAREWSAKVSYDGVESVADMRVAAAAAAAGIGSRDFMEYLTLMRKPGKNAEEIPHFHVRGEELGIEGDWVIRRLESDDPQGPMLGLRTDCCQHLGGAARACAISGVRDSDAAFAVIEYRGRLVAQSFMWRSTKDHVVFDSIEAKGEAYIEAIAKMVVGAANAIIGRLGVTSVRVGDTSYGVTNAVRGVLEGKPCEVSAKPSRHHYRDGDRQWSIPGVP